MVLYVGVSVVASVDAVVKDVLGRFLLVAEGMILIAGLLKMVAAEGTGLSLVGAIEARLLMAVRFCCRSTGTME